MFGMFFRFKRPVVVDCQLVSGKAPLAVTGTNPEFRIWTPLDASASNVQGNKCLLVPSLDLI
jgi:hypothetical protein